MQQTLRLTLNHLKITEPTLKCDKVIASLEVGQYTKTIPNPRFVRDSVANFYNCKLEVDIIVNGGPDDSQEAVIRIEGFEHPRTHDLGSVSIALNNLSAQKGGSCEYSNHLMTLQYHIQVVRELKESLEEDSSLAIDQSFSEENIIEDVLCVMPANTRYLSLPPDWKQIEPSLSPTASCKSGICYAETSTDSVFQRSAESLHPRSKSNYSFSKNSSLAETESEYQFIQPITHSSPLSPCTPKRVTFQQSRGSSDLQVSRCVFQRILICRKSLLVYVVVSAASFLLGTLLKQGLSL